MFGVIQLEEDISVTNLHQLVGWREVMSCMYSAFMRPQIKSAEIMVHCSCLHCGVNLCYRLVDITTAPNSTEPDVSQTSSAFIGQIWSGSGENHSTVQLQLHKVAKSCAVSMIDLRLETMQN